MMLSILCSLELARRQRETPEGSDNMQLNEKDVSSYGEKNHCSW